MARILFFGRLSELIGFDERELDLPHHVRDTQSLREWLDSEFQTDGELLLSINRIAINAQITQENADLSNADEVAFLPPVGGG
ncbi:molybdopterin converting factor subunit 1 [Ponticaulis profundi]|uniref:Molybdopterin converting factor subunit 1 n=1 Tax=Ponticaulis profundi TaxID=2665222 RepID=A0ABW1SEW0_9PROT